jgi:hypothetical protein
MPPVGFEPTISVLERAKKGHERHMKKKMGTAMERRESKVDLYGKVRAHT